MCGIAGVIQYESELSRETRQRALKILFSEIMLKTEPRGKDATGLYQVHDDGDWLMTKKGQKVTEWLVANKGGGNEDPIVYSEIMDLWLEHPRELKALVGHCRAATVGSRGKDNNDNHPFAVQLDEKNAILGIHNGTLNNHEKIFEKLPDYLPRHGTVDSESLFHFMYHLSDKGTKPVDGDMLKYMGERVEGAAAVIAVNTRFPDQVITFRKERPMEYYMIAPLNILVIASEKPFVESALEKYDFLRNFIPEYRNLPKLETGHRVLVGENYRIFDASLPWPEGRPIHHDFDKISVDEGTMWKTNAKVLEDWAGPQKNTYTSTTSTSSKSGAVTTGSSSTTSVKTTKKNDKKVTAAAAKGDDDKVVTTDATVVEVEIGTTPEAKEAMKHVAALGVVVKYDSIKEVAESIGAKESEIENMDGVELANKLAALNFGIGHAAASLSAESEISSIRRKAADKTGQMEKLAEKQKRAQNHIWEYRQLMSIICALHVGGYRMSLRNVELALTGFPNLAQKRKQDILTAARGLLESKDTRALVKDLVQAFESAGDDAMDAAASS